MRNAFDSVTSIFIAPGFFSRCDQRNQQLQQVIQESASGRSVDPETASARSPPAIHEPSEATSVEPFRTAKSLRRKVTKHETMAGVHAPVQHQACHHERKERNGSLICIGLHVSAYFSNSSKADEKEPKAEEIHTAEDL